METLQPTTTLFGWPLVLMLLAVFLLNFFIARYLTARLVEQKFIKKNSEELKKAMLLWVFPIVGALGLFMLLWTYKVMKFWKSFSKWLFLKHA